MNKTEFINYVSDTNGIYKVKAADMVNTVFDSIIKVLETGDSIEIKGLGAFMVVDRAERNGRNPATGESIVIPAKKSLKFKWSKALKDSLNQE